MEEELNEDAAPLPVQEDKLVIQILHQRQRYTWDCGISCVLMVLPQETRQDFLKNFHAVCKDEGILRSTWTIDLCYLLQRYNQKHVFLTVTLGVHPSYKSNSFYTSILSKDEVRVTKRFQAAPSNGICIKQSTISMSEIVKHLKRKGPVIVLTNAKLLHCDSCRLNRLSVEIRQCIPWPQPYQGHYVVLCGYNNNQQKIYYRNPSVTDRICVMSMADMDEARLTYGTDEDVILIYN